MYVDKLKIPVPCQSASIPLISLMCSDFCQSNRDNTQVMVACVVRVCLEGYSSMFMRCKIPRIIHSLGIICIYYVTSTYSRCQVITIRERALCPMHLHRSQCENAFPLFLAWSKLDANAAHLSTTRCSRKGQIFVVESSVSHATLFNNLGQRTASPVPIKR